MLRRCHSPQDSRYKDYGARGIFVCEEWRQDFKAFYDHIGPRPGDEYSVERIRNNEGYKPGNVKWATPIEQNNNKRTNVTAVIGGEVMTAAQIARAYGLTWRMVQYRIERGMDEAQIIAPSTWRRNAQT